MKKITTEQMQKAMECKTADELLALAQAEGVELTREQAAEFIKQQCLREITYEELTHVAGGTQAQDMYEVAANGGSGCDENYNPYHTIHL